jgi:hypothetical protein
VDVEHKEITVRELVEGYKDNQDEGIFGFHGKLDIRPPYQRNFVYDDPKRDAVINSVRANFPLNVMYWAVRDDGNFEVIDGQQRTISLCQYVEGSFSIDGLAFHNLQDDEQDQILDYSLDIYRCSGAKSEKLKWFRIINIAGEKLTEQELRNAIYSGSWITDAKRYFSRQVNRPTIGDAFLSGKANRQEFLETVICWISNDSIDDYMSDHQHDPDAKQLWKYFQTVIEWINATFSVYRPTMRGVPFGILYNQFKNEKYSSKKLETEIARLMEDEYVSNKKGIYSYVLTKKEKFLNIRAFNDNQKIEAYERQKGFCNWKCKKHFRIEEMQADHITPWHAGGKTISENCQMLCAPCNRAKSGM